MRRRSVLGVSLCALLAGCGSGRTSGEEGASGECVPASEAMSSPSVSPSRKSDGSTVDIVYFPEDYIAAEGLAVSPDGALVAASPIVRPGSAGKGGAHGVVAGRTDTVRGIARAWCAVLVGGWPAPLRSPMNARDRRFRAPGCAACAEVNNRPDSHDDDTCRRRGRPGTKEKQWIS